MERLTLVPLLPLNTKPKTHALPIIPVGPFRLIPHSTFKDNRLRITGIPPVRAMTANIRRKGRPMFGHMQAEPIFTLELFARPGNRRSIGNHRGRPAGRLDRVSGFNPAVRLSSRRFGIRSFLCPRSKDQHLVLNRLRGPAVWRVQPQ